VDGIARAAGYTSTHMSSRFARCSFVALAASLAACASSSAPNGSVPNDAASGCSNDPRVTAIAAGLVERGTTLGIALVTLTPATITKGDNDWMVELRDASGTPLDGATITATPFMPDHGHGSSVVPTITALGQGRYDVAHVELVMPGVWQITFDVTTAAGAHDSIVFTACVSS
jgi:hypothetical protein